MDELARLILEHESDTFSASARGLTPQVAQKMARALFKRFCKVVAEGGTFRCDGDVLADTLDEVMHS